MDQRGLYVVRLHFSPKLVNEVKCLPFELVHLMVCFLTLDYLGAFLLLVKGDAAILLEQGCKALVGQSYLLFHLG